MSKSYEKMELVRNQALVAEKMKLEQEEMEILLASKKSQLDVKTTYKASILGCFQGFLAITSDTNRTSGRSIQESPSTDKLTDLEPKKALINDKSPQNDRVAAAMMRMVWCGPAGRDRRVTIGVLRWPRRGPPLLSCYLHPDNRQPASQQAGCLHQFS
jgi:hypothetical protein